MNQWKILLLVGMFFSASCKTNRIDLQELANNGEEIIRMERTPCFGTCPTYEVRIFNNGLLWYNGKKNTGFPGCHYSRLSEKEMTVLKESFLEAGFFELMEKYPMGEKAPVDLPTTIIFFKNGNLSKSITDYHWQTPEELAKLEAGIDSLVSNKKMAPCP